MKGRYAQFCDGFLFALSIPFGLLGCVLGWIAAAFTAGVLQGWRDWKKIDSTSTAPCVKVKESA